MAETAAFKTASALLSGQPGVFVERAAAHDIARSLTPAERGSLLPLYWANLHAIDSAASPRNMLAHMLGWRPDQPSPQFDAAALMAGLQALTALYVAGRPQVFPDGKAQTLADLHSGITGWLWAMLQHLNAPPGPAAQAQMRALLPVMHGAEAAQRLAVARLAADPATIATATATLMTAGHSPMEAREWQALFAAEPMDFITLTAPRLRYANPLDGSDHNVNPVLDRVPGYGIFAAALMAEAATRLHDIAQGTVPYRADGAFVLDDCHVLNRIIGYGLYLGADWCLQGIETFWLNAATAPAPAAKTMPSQSLTIGLGNAVVAEPWPQAYLALCKVASACRHAGVAKKLARFQKAALTALAARPERMLDFDPAMALPKPLHIAFRDAVQGLMARSRPHAMADWQRHFSPTRADGWKLAQGLIWEIVGHDGAHGITCLPLRSKAGVVWQDVAGATVTPAPDARVRLWHPVETPPALAQGWRARLQVLGISQPFLQAVRQIFTPDTAELASNSTRHFAGQTVDGAALFGLSRVAGWRAGFQDELHLMLEGARFTFHAGIRAAPVGGMGTTGDLVLDRLPTGVQPTLGDLPPRLLSEAMRRVDLLVTVGARAA